MKHPETIIKYDSFPWEKVFPDLLWIIFWLVIFLFVKNFIFTILTTMVNRLKHGAGVKIGSFEIDSLKVLPNNSIQNNHFITTEDEGNTRNKQRNDYYKVQRGAMLVHKIFKSQKNGQLYDILIYIIPQKNCNLIQVTSVEYYFGKFWGKNIFSSLDRSNGFAIATSAYGAFLCTAKINFNDGKSETVYRYIDFEMGDVACIVDQEQKPKS
ncbi:hypothetical protein SAMN05444671_4442 [Flavobacterium sp. CF108]|jgi:hypothetical protein|uniref:pYEATS domain-containing protein n=1 Tax=unclassified Flavobacterium TaxID=196869 RepID=UPI0008D8960E|nr:MULTISPECIES: pYEATS domain-containing protein [unclassified Flavobacterium]SEP08446.1 hypothetical protein SAMN04487978_4442 [Flavobacterium sp. fv08]SHH96243.1 hypothetical protein SAMN05444671_4442 [Flavobacterium sp. CF108]